MECLIEVFQIEFIVCWWRNNGFDFCRGGCWGIRLRCRREPSPRMPQRKAGTSLIRDFVDAGNLYARSRWANYEIVTLIDHDACNHSVAPTTPCLLYPPGGTD